MINFRYHLVSVTAVFLALAIGLVLGTTALNGPTLEVMSDQVATLRDDNATLRDQVLELETAAANEQEFADAVAPATLNATLEDQNILVLSVSAADQAHVAGVVNMLGYSGAANVGQLTFTDNFVEPGNSDILVDLVADLTPTDIEPPNNNDGVESASALLAATLFSEGPGTADDRDALIKALVELQMVTVDEKLGEQATAVIIVTGKPYSGTEASGQNANVLMFVDQFGQHGPVVCAAPTGAGDGNVVSAILGDAELAESISTVDNAAGPEGQLATVMAVPERIGGTAGHYGTGEGATALVPEPS
ncbi:copper transport outer membrane protein MctB [Stackebrandtia endophytica]|uniref:Copper transport outer membrane protein MctB n=1 Tax=Stackebrandtia endophytica TaxID=1496996 RepID=A0A543AQZ0_9ACTN|nr:copper transporter [Stackebrandtia endophytica]TQL75001.1 copper transport outer membrane protein MctB [Stackebrandtia endophytica]